jgi:four helix bundle protein
MSYRKLRVWQCAFQANLVVYKKIKPSPIIDRSLMDQTRRAAVSVILNIAEGYSRDSLKEKVRFLDIAYASANETQAALSIIQGLLDSEDAELQELYNRYESICKQLFVFKQKLKSHIK